MTSNFEVRRPRRRRSFPEDTPIPVDFETPLVPQVRSQQRDVLNSTTSEEHTYEEPYTYSEGGGEGGEQRYARRNNNNDNNNNHTIQINTVTVGKADLPSFTGSNKDDVKSFFKKFERISECNSWTREKMIKVIPITFSKQAEFFYDQLDNNVKKSYQRLKSAMLERFSSAQMRCKMKAELYKLKQENCESLEDYIIRLEEISFQLDLTSEQKLDALLNGLNDSLRRSATMKQFTTFEEAVNYVTLRDSMSTSDTTDTKKMLQDLHKKMEELSTGKVCSVQSKKEEPEQMNTFGQPNFASTTDTMREFSRLRAKIRSLEQNQRRPQRDRSVGFNSRYLRTTDGQPICHSCLRVGHTGRFCNERRSGQGNNQRSRNNQFNNRYSNNGNFNNDGNRNFIRDGNRNFNNFSDGNRSFNNNSRQRSHHDDDGNDGGRGRDPRIPYSDGRRFATRTQSAPAATPQEQGYTKRETNEKNNGYTTKKNNFNYIGHMASCNTERNDPHYSKPSQQHNVVPTFYPERDIYLNQDDYDEYSDLPDLVDDDYDSDCSDYSPHHTYSPPPSYPSNNHNSQDCQPKAEDEKEDSIEDGPDVEYQQIKHQHVIGPGQNQTYSDSEDENRFKQQSQYDVFDFNGQSNEDKEPLLQYESSDDEEPDGYDEPEVKQSLLMQHLIMQDGSNKVTSNFATGEAASVRIWGKLLGWSCLFLIDSGAAISAISVDLWNDIKDALKITPSTEDIPTLVTANKGELTIHGSISLPLEIEQERYMTKLYIIDGLSFSIVLGHDFLVDNNGTINYREKNLTLEINKPVQTVTGEDKSISFGSMSNNKQKTNLFSKKKRTIRPLSQEVWQFTQKFPTGDDYLFEPSEELQEQTSLSITPAVFRGSTGRVTLKVTSLKESPVKIPAGSFLGTLTKISTIAPIKEVESSNNEEGGDVTQLDEKSIQDQATSKRIKVNPDDKKSTQVKINPELTEDQQKQVQKLIDQYEETFAATLQEIGTTPLVKHIIHTGDAAAIRQRPYRVSPKQREVIDKELDQMIEKGLVRKSTSAWASPLIVVPKPTGGVRVCFDYRAVNKVTTVDSHPLPRVDDLLDHLKGAKYFSKIDLKSGFWQIPMEESSIPKTAFCTHRGLYECVIMPMGLKNSPMTFERLIEHVFTEELWKSVLVYLDDIIIFSRSFEDHMLHLKFALDKLAEANLKAHPGKCDLAETEITFLGHIISAKGIRPNEENTRRVREFPQPRNVKEVRSFLGLCSYYRRFVKGFSNLASPLYNLTKLGVKFCWNEECEKAFQELKKILTSEPVVALPDFTRRFYLQTDASLTGIGWTLSQRYDNLEKAVIYGGRRLDESEQRLSVIEREALAIVTAVKKLHPYLHGRQFTILTDHKPLNYILNTKDSTGKLCRWSLYLQAYDFVIEYRPGKANGNADGLSRIPWDQLQAQAQLEPKRPKERGMKKTKDSKSHPEMNNASISNSTENKSNRSKNNTIQMDNGEPSFNEPSNLFKEEQKDMNNGEEPFKNLQQMDEPDENSSLNNSSTDGEKDEGVEQLFAAITENTFNKEEIRRHQLADPSLRSKIDYLKDKILPEGIQRNAVLKDIDNYLLDDGVLYHIYSPKTVTPEGVWKQLVIPKKFRAEIMRHNHDEPTAAHFGFAKTADKIRRRYYWTGMLTDIQAWINTCIICQQDKGTPSKKAPLLPIATGEPWSALHCDIVGPFPRTDAGNRYVVVFIERLTSWIEAFPLASCESHAIAEILLHEIIFRYGIPRYFVTDQGSNFLSHLMAEVCTMLNIKKINTTPYHPQANGIVERLNGTLVKGISHYCSSRQTDWDEYLPSVLFAYRTSMNASRKDSPYYLMFGREATLPTDLQFNPGRKLSPQVEDHRARIVSQVQVAQRLARVNLRKSQRKDKHYYDKKASNVSFQVGDEVWLHNKAKKKGLSPKLMAKWLGPFRITKKLSEVNYELTDLLNKRKPTAVHVNRLKPYCDPNFRVIDDGTSDDLSDDSDEIEEPLYEDEGEPIGSQGQIANPHPGGEEMNEDDQKDEAEFEDDSPPRKHYEETEETDSEDSIYMIEEILKVKIRRNKRYFLIKWEGYPHSQNTWEPEENLDSSLVEEFMKNRSKVNSISFNTSKTSPLKWSLCLVFVLLPIVFGSRIGDLYDCTTTTPLGVYEFPKIPTCAHTMDKNSKLITKEMEVFKYSPNVTHFNIHYCTLYKITSVCDWKPRVAWSKRAASKKETSDSEESYISPAQCIKAYNTRSYDGNPLESKSGNRLTSSHPDGKTANCRYWRKVTLKVNELTIRTFPAQVIGKAKYIEQHLTQSRCASEIPKGQTYGSCHMKDAPKGALVWNDPHHPAQDWHSLGKHEVKQMESHILIPSLRIGGSIQNEYGESKTTLLLDNGLLLKDPIMKENMFEALQNIVTEYSKRMASDTLGPILQAHIMRTLINQKLTIIQEWERLCFVQQEVSRIQRWMIEVFPTTAARWIHQESGVTVHLIGEALQVHRCLKISNYRLITNRKVGNYCYADIPIKAPYSNTIRFLRLTDRQVMDKSHKINCSERPPVTYLQNTDGSYDVIDRDGNVTKATPKKQFKGANFVKLARIRGYDSRMIQKPPHHLAPYSMLNIFTEIHESMEEMRRIQMEHGNGNLLTGIGVGLGGIIQAAAGGTSQIIGALGNGIQGVLTGAGDLDEKIVNSLGSAASNIITSTGDAVESAGKGIGNLFNVFGGVGGTIKWVIILFLLGAFAYLNRASLMKIFTRNVKKKFTPAKEEAEETNQRLQEVRGHRNTRIYRSHHHRHRSRRRPTTEIHKDEREKTFKPSTGDVFTYVHHNTRRNRTERTRVPHGQILAISSKTNDEEEKQHGIKTEVFLSLEGETKSYMALIDTGSTHSLLKKSIWDAAEIAPFLSHVDNPCLISVTGEIINTAGSAIIPASIVDPRSVKNKEFMVVPGIETDVIIGTDILESEDAIINFYEKTITSGTKNVKFQAGNCRKGRSRFWIYLTCITLLTALTMATLYTLTVIEMHPALAPDVAEKKNLTKTPMMLPTMLMVRKGNVLSEWTRHVIVMEFPIPRVLHSFLSKSGEMVLGIFSNSSQVNTTMAFERLNAKCRIRVLRH